MKKLKERWGITSNFQLVIIFIVFSVTGSASIYISRPAIKALGITKENLHWALYWPLFIITAFICYQIMLVVIGTLFGQRKFFWNFEKKTLRRLGIKLDKD